MPRRKRPRPAELVAAHEELEEAQRLQQEQEQKVQKAREKVEEARQVLAAAELRLIESQERLSTMEQTSLQQARDKVREAELQEESPWNRQYKKLKAFKEQHGHVRVPNRCPDNKELDRLCIWVNAQKQKHRHYRDGIKKGRKPYQMEALEKLGLDWTPQQKKWDKHFENLKLFQQQHGHAQVPQHYQENKKLAMWVGLQRYEYKLFKEGKKTNMSQDRIDRLNSVGFVWNVFDKKWREMYDKLVEFREETGHVMLPERYPPDQSLANWCCRQRQEYALYVNGQQASKKCQMTQERIKLLEDIGFELC